MSLYGNTFSVSQLDPASFPTPEEYSPGELPPIYAPPPPLPPQAIEEPLYVNARQYHRILKRRLQRAKLESLDTGQKQSYKHESRHNHAMRRPRGVGGRFLTKQEIAELAEKEKERTQNGETTNMMQAQTPTAAPPRHAPLCTPHAIAPYHPSHSHIHNRRSQPYPSPATHPLTYTPANEYNSPNNLNIGNNHLNVVANTTNSNIPNNFISPIHPSQPQGINSHKTTNNIPNESNNVNYVTTVNNNNNNNNQQQQQQQQQITNIQQQNFTTTYEPPHSFSSAPTNSVNLSFYV